MYSHIASEDNRYWHNQAYSPAHTILCSVMHRKPQSRRADCVHAHHQNDRWMRNYQHRRAYSVEGRSLHATHLSQGAKRRECYSWPTLNALRNTCCSCIHSSCLIDVEHNCWLRAMWLLVDSFESRLYVRWYLRHHQLFQHSTDLRVFFAASALVGSWNSNIHWRRAEGWGSADHRFPMQVALLQPKSIRDP